MHRFLSVAMNKSPLLYLDLFVSVIQRKAIISV